MKDKVILKGKKGLVLSKTQELTAAVFTPKSCLNCAHVVPDKTPAKKGEWDCRFLPVDVSLAEGTQDPEYAYECPEYEYSQSKEELCKRYVGMQDEK